MKIYEIHVSASYITDGADHKAWNCFKEYVKAENAEDAQRILESSLYEEGYIDIEMDEAIEA